MRMLPYLLSLITSSLKLIGSHDSIIYLPYFHVTRQTTFAKRTTINKLARGHVAVFNTKPVRPRIAVIYLAYNRPIENIRTLEAFRNPFTYHVARVMLTNTSVGVMRLPSNYLEYGTASILSFLYFARPAHAIANKLATRIHYYKNIFVLFPLSDAIPAFRFAFAMLAIYLLLALPRAQRYPIDTLSLPSPQQQNSPYVTSLVIKYNFEFIL